MKEIMSLIIMIGSLNFCFAQQPGSIDSSFGENGKVTSSIFQDFTSVLQKDDKIVIGGVGNAGNNLYTVLTRLLPDGSVDRSFGDTGYVPNYFTEYFQSVRGISVLPDGSIVTAASGSRKDPTSQDILLSKYKQNGTLDSTFGVDGKVVDHLATLEGTVDVAMQSDGKIVVLGFIVTDLQQQYNATFVARYNPDGSLDKGFADNGHAILYEFDIAVPAALAIDADSKIVIGITTTSNYPYVFLARLNTNGSYDSSFGYNGIKLYDVPHSQQEYINTLTILKNGKILAAGAVNTQFFGPKKAKMMVIRFNHNGNVDKTFGDSGTALVKFDTRDAEARGIAVQKNGKIILTGQSYSYEETPPLGAFAIAKLTEDGMIDSSFAINGKDTLDFGGFDLARSVLVQNTGKIVCIGDGKVVYSAVRYYGDSIKRFGPLAKKIRRWIHNHTLNWEYNNDDDVSYYSIQQSNNSVNGFKEIARMQSQKSKLKSQNEEAVYSYNLNISSAQSTKLTAQRSTYYRITAVSNNGSIVISDVISDENISSVTVSPNPVKDELKISGLPSTQKSTINIVNRNGNIVQSAICNNTICNINVAQLHSGIYNVAVTTNGKIQTVKFVKE